MQRLTELRDNGSGVRPRRGVAVALAEGLGLGRLRPAPGTWGTLPGVALVAALWPLLAGGGLVAQIAVAAALALAAVPLCAAGERYHGRKDPGAVVADEYLCFPICMIGLPPSLPLLAVAFVTFRLCDILKPFPAYRAQRLPGGWGIVADDALASLWALGANHLLARWLGI